MAVLYNVMHLSNIWLSFAYIKEIINGESFIELGDEEANALQDRQLLEEWVMLSLAEKSTI